MTSNLAQSGLSLRQPQRMYVGVPLIDLFTDGTLSEISDLEVSIIIEEILKLQLNTGQQVKYLFSSSVRSFFHDVDFLPTY